MSRWLELGPFTVFDLETTGMRPVYDRIVEIGAVRIDLDGSMACFSTLVDPSCHIPECVTRVHGITDDMVAGAPKFKDAAYKFLDFASGTKFVAHNARFDLSFMQESLARHGMQQLQGAFDSIALTRKAYPGLPSYSLQSLNRTFMLDDGSFEGQAHRAGYDAVITAELFKIVMKRLVEQYG